MSEQLKSLKVISSRHSAFYTPLLLAVELGSTDKSFMKSVSKEFECTYATAQNNENVFEKIFNNEVDIAQTSVSGSWNNDYSREIVHFAEINKMDGFQLVKRLDGNEDKNNIFNWEDLKGKEILIDHSLQPLNMFKFACFKKNINFDDLNIVNNGSPENMIKVFREGKGDFIHLQAPQSIDLTYDMYDDEGKEIIRQKVGYIAENIGKIIGPLSVSYTHLTLPTILRV